MVVEINAAIQSIKVLSDLIKANRSLRNFNELVAAVSEVNAKLMDAHSVALASQEKQATLSQRISDLEKENAELKDWNREAECYQLSEITTGVLAYRPKPGMKTEEPSHLLCANCFTKREKSFLQPDPPGLKRDTYRCPRCKNEIIVPSSRKIPKADEPEDWTNY